MKLTSLYSNKNDIFERIDFNNDFNVVLAEIRLPENREKDTHNLGKTTLGRLLDFCFLSTRNQGMFLFKHFDIFKSFVFYLEVELPNGENLTIRRGVEKATKISFKRHKNKKENYCNLPDDGWDHFDVAFSRAKVLLDGLLDWEGIKPWDYRKSLGYQLRSQDDYQDIFQLKKFAGSHSGWKPFLAHILGFDCKLITSHYEKEKAYEEKEALRKNLKSELGDVEDDVGKIEGIHLLKKSDVEKKQSELDAFDFREQDKEKTEQIVNEIDDEIARLNSERYSLNYNKKKITDSLCEGKVLFDPLEAERLFKEAGIMFQGQIVKSFEQLISFNKEITEERRTYLSEELNEIEENIKSINSRLSELNQERSQQLQFISAADVFEKYKMISNEVVSIKADMELLDRQLGMMRRLKELRSDLRQLNEDRDHLHTKIEVNVEENSSDEHSMFSNIRLRFSEIVEEVIGRKALLTVRVNKEGHLEFKAEILDKSGNATSADLGHTYRKLLCIAFDLAVLRVHENIKFPKFVYHDGAFESLDGRKKEKLLGVFREYTKYGIQSVVTVIDSDMPEMAEGHEFFRGDEIILTLHDENENGRLFKMAAW